MKMGYSLELGLMWEFDVSDNFDDGEGGRDDGRGEGHIDSADVLSFGQYAVLAPGVQIILDGRAVSTFLGG